MLLVTEAGKVTFPLEYFPRRKQNIPKCLDNIRFREWPVVERLIRKIVKESYGLSSLCDELVDHQRRCYIFKSIGDLEKLSALRFATTSMTKTIGSRY